jgi:type I restriction enzyme S subunit
MLTKRKIGDFVRIKHGFSFLGEHFADEGKYIVLTPGNFFEAGGFKRTPGKEKYYDADFPEEYLCSEGDLIVAMTQQAEGLLGSTAIVPEGGTFLHNQRIGLISWDETISEKMYIYYLFMTDLVRQQIRRTASGSKVKHTSPERIYDVTVWIPDDVKIQKRISRTLENIDDKVTLNKTINAELENTAKLLYDYWFIQFDFPDENGKPYRSSGGPMEYNTQLKREIPKGWDVRTLGQVLKEVESGKRPAGGALQSGIPSIGAENIESLGVHDFKKEKYISQDFFSNMRKGVVKSGDVLLYKDGAYSGKASMALDGFPHQNCAVNEHVFILRTNNDLPSQFFLYLFLKRPENYNKLNAIASSKAAQPGLNQDQLNSVNVPVPPRELVLLFDRTISPMMHKIASCANQSKYLNALHDFLLPLLMNGQVTVPMADTVVEQAPVATAEQPETTS